MPAVFAVVRYAFLNPARKTPLPPGFEYRHGDGVRQVQAALAGEHRQAETSFRRKFGHRFGGQATRFSTEDEHVVSIEGHEIGAQLAARGDGEEASASQCRLAVSPVGMTEHAGKFVVIQSGAPERTVFPFEAQWFDEMQFASGVGAKPDDVAGVGRNLWLKQYDGSQIGGSRGIYVVC